MGTLVRIGELAELGNVSKRTIDYYTNLGFFKPIRSESNYRFYSLEDLETLQFIESCKKMNIPLAEIQKMIVDKKENAMTLSKSSKNTSETIQIVTEKVMELKKLLKEVTTEAAVKSTEELSQNVTELILALQYFL